MKYEILKMKFFSISGFLDLFLSFVMNDFNSIYFFLRKLTIDGYNPGIFYYNQNKINFYDLSGTKVSKY